MRCVTIASRWYTWMRFLCFAHLPSFAIVCQYNFCAHRCTCAVVVPFRGGVGRGASLGDQPLEGSGGPSLGDCSPRGTYAGWEMAKGGGGRLHYRQYNGAQAVHSWWCIIGGIGSAPAVDLQCIVGGALTYV